MNEKFNVYPCTKHAITAFTASLLNELASCKCRIKVTVSYQIKSIFWNSVILNLNIFLFL